MKMKHNNKGFSLVELIVVIAIMAILGGVGTAGYTKYIEQTNKKADMALVGNVVRAVESGVYSYAYPVDEKLQPSSKGIKIPMGFVVLSENGAEVVQSTGERTETSTNPCTRSGSKIDVYSVKYYESSTSFGVSGYYLVKSSFNYCTTHSDTPQTTTISDLKESLQVDKIYNTYGLDTPLTKWTEKYDDSKSFYIKGDFKCFECGTSSDTSKSHYEGKEFPATSTYSSFELTDSTNSTIRQMLAASFGDNYSDTTALKYMGWKAFGDNPSFFTAGTSLWSKTEDLGNKLAPYSGLTILGKDVTTGKYENAEELVTSFASALVTKYPATSDKSGAEVFYEKAWKPVDDSTDNLVPRSASNLFYHGYDFGFGEREYYCACRTAYNEAFAAYVEAHTHSGHTASTCAKNIRNYGEFMLVATLPQLTCRSSLKRYDTNGTGALACSACYELYDNYVKTGVSKENAIAFYDTMVTVNETAATASGSALGFFDYYNAYLKEFEGLYDKVDSLTAGKKSAIVLTFYYEDGLVKYDVTPTSANPRNK